MPNMMPVSPYELASMQADAVAAVCDKPCAIMRKVAPGRDIYGHQTQSSYQQIAETMCGVAEPTATHLQNYDYVIGSLAAWQVKLPVGTDIAHQDRIVVEGQTLEVHVLLNPRSYAGLLTVLAAEVK